MLNPGTLLEARDLIKTTVSDRSAWPHVLQRLSSVIPSDGAWLVPETSVSADLPKTPSLEGMLHAYFAEGWHGTDRLYHRSLHRFRAGQPIVSSMDICDDRYFNRSEFHNEFARKHDLQSFMAISFRSDERTWGISFLRSIKKGHYTQLEKDSAAMLIDDLATAATVTSLLGQEAVGALHRTLDLVEKAALALDARGAVVHANSRCRQMLSKIGEDLSISRDGRILARDRVSNAAIYAAIARASGGADRRDDIVPIGIARREGKPILTKAVPLRAVTVNPFLEAKLLLIFSDTDPEPSVTAERIRDALKVTPAESRLLLALRTGHSLISASVALGITRETGRTQLKTIYRKLDVHSQRELLDLLRQI